MSPAKKSPPPARRPTMTDVAQAAGVSQSTVSMVLNRVSGARLAAETRARVLDTAVQLGYQLPRRGPDATADAHHPPVIGYLVDEISTSPHPVVSIDGARDAAWQQGCVLHIAVTRNNPEQEAAALAALRSLPGLVGLIYSTIFTREVQLPLTLTSSLQDLPVVLLNCHDPAHSAPAVVPAELAGGHAATEHLIAQGHRRIAFINGEPWMEAAKDRLKGYRRALATADLPLDPALVCDGDWMSGSGFRHTLRLMQRPGPPTALFCANDLMAVGALEALKQLGLRVPEDVSVMGYDDQEIARHTHPPLSTVVLPNYEMGQAAVELLLQGRRAGGGRSPRALTKVDGPLVLRGSVAPPKH